MCVCVCVCVCVWVCLKPSLRLIQGVQVLTEGGDNTLVLVGILAEDILSREHTHTNIDINIHVHVCTCILYTSVKIIQYGCRDAPCEKSWKQGNPLSNTIKDTSTIMRNPLSELCREGYA